MEPTEPDSLPGQAIEAHLSERSRVRAAIVADDIAAVRAEYDQLATSLAGLEVRSAEEGRFYPADPHELIGKYLRQGDVVGYVIRAASPVRSQSSALRTRAVASGRSQ